MREVVIITPELANPFDALIIFEARAYSQVGGGWSGGIVHPVIAIPGETGLAGETECGDKFQVF